MGMLWTSFRETIQAPTFVSWHGYDPGEVVGFQQELQHLGGLFVGLNAQNPDLSLLGIAPATTLFG
jgi:hypothetical protein